MTVPAGAPDASSVDDTPIPLTTAGWQSYFPDYVPFTPTASVGSACECPTDGALALHVAGCKQGVAGMAQPFAAAFCGEYDLTPNVLVTASALGAALRGISEAGLVSALQWEADDRDLDVAVRTARGPELTAKFAELGRMNVAELKAKAATARVEHAEGLNQGLAAATAVSDLLEPLRSKTDEAEFDAILDAVNQRLDDPTGLRGYLQAELDALGGDVTAARAAQDAEREAALAAAMAALAAVPPTPAPPFTVPPAPGAVPPAPDVVPPPTATGPVAPPTPAAPNPATQELADAEAALDADPGDIYAAAVIQRHDQQRELTQTLMPYLHHIPDLDDRNGEVIAAMKLTRAARTEAVDAALSGRLMLLGLKIRDLAPTSRDAKAAWERVREPEVSGDRYVDGGSFIHDIPDVTPAVWGRGSDILWAEGEDLIVAAPQGVGKSTLAGLLVQAMIEGGEVLGYPVAKLDRILYLAMDRPQQIARALARQLKHLDRETISRHLEVWKGPPPEDLAKYPDRLLAMATKARANIVVVDSLKDAALGLSSDEVGAGWNRARQTLLAAGVQLLVLHHDRKANETNAPVVEKIYGSIWITGGSGSIIHLDGEPGDPIVRFTQVKKPADEVGPYTLSVDNTAGTMEIFEAVDLLAMCRQPGGLSATAAAAALFEEEKPNRAQREKARRRLEKLKSDGLVSAVVVAGITMYTAASYNSFQVPGT